MKKLIFGSVMILIAVMTFGQGLQKGNLTGQHVMTMTLKPGVTMDQFTAYYKDKYIAAISKLEAIP